jgi:hypothetical protein
VAQALPAGKRPLGALKDVEDEHRSRHLSDGARRHPGLRGGGHHPGINLNTLGIILLLTGLIAVLYSLLFWSNLSPWGRRRTVARRPTVVEERPVEVIEERPFDDGLP